MSEMSQVINTIHSQANMIKNSFSGKDLNAAQQQGNFGHIMLKGINEINSLQTASQQMAQQHLLGSSEVELNDVMIAQQKATVALNFGIQVRNKMVSAYQEIMNLSL